jgi:hypothetical protein
MRQRPERLTAFSALAALALGAAGTMFERAGPATLAAGPEELRAWARTHHRALVAQSVVFGTSTAPLLVFFAGLGGVLHRRCRQTARGSADLSPVVLGGGAMWAAAQLVGQALQVSMASAAEHQEHAGFVASLGDLMRSTLRVGNVPLSAALGACAVMGLRDRALPRALSGLSAATALAHVVPVVAGSSEKRTAPTEAAVTYAPYLLFVAWMLGVATHLLRPERDPR